MSDSTSPSSAPLAQLFDAVSVDYDQSGVPFFQPIAEGLVTAVSPQPGERALDIGCGRGAVTGQLARAVLPAGALTGIDLSPEMVRYTRDLLAAQGAEATVEVMDACDPDLPDAAYDLITSSLVLFFLPDPAAVVRRWLGLLAPGGRMGIATFGQQDPAWAAVDDEFVPWLPPGLRDARTFDEQGPFASDAGMEELLVRAGATDVRTEGFRLPVRFGDAAGWERFSRGTGQLAMWGSVPADEIAGLRSRCARLLDATRDADGQVVVWQDIRYTLGRAVS